MKKVKLEFDIDLHDRESIRDVIISMSKSIKILSKVWRRMDIT